jgi:hypothetical protein
MHKYLTRIVVAIIMAISAIVVAYIQFVRKPNSKPQLINFKYVGRVIDKDSERPIRGAKVTFEFQGAPPIVYTDSEGIYSFPVLFTGDNIDARVRVESEGYENFDRNITLTIERKLEDIRLTKIPINMPRPKGENTGNTDSTNENQKPQTGSLNQPSEPTSLRKKQDDTDSSIVFIDVNSNRKGAHVFVNNAFVGIAPCSLKLRNGPNKLKVVYEDKSVRRSWQYEDSIYVSGYTKKILTNNDFLRIKQKQDE